MQCSEGMIVIGENRGSTGYHSVTQHNKIEQSVVPTTHDNYHQDRSTMLTLH